MSDALGWMLAHFLWQGALLGAVAWAALRALPERLAELRYAVSCALLAAMALCPLVTFALLAASRGTVEPFYALQPFATPPVAPWTEWAVTAWLVGLVAMSVRAAGGWALAWRRQRRDRHPLSAALRETVRRLAERVELSRAVRWFASARVETPQVFGWLKPVVLVPMSALAAMPPEQLEALLAHELAHIRRHDFLVNAGQVLIETVLFYHPAVWWLSARIREEREACCDRVAALVCGDAVLYGRALLTLEETRERYALAASGSGLAPRIRRLLGTNEGPRPSWLGAALVAVVVAAAGWSMAQPALGQGAPLSQAHTNWLQQEVRYIIPLAERTRFLALGSNEEREHFIAQFWQRRPGARKEHYRKLSYARERFGSTVCPRSRAYIVFGPPDENESHPGDPVPYEIWRWRNGRKITFGGPDYLPDGPWPAK